MSTSIGDPFLLSSYSVPHKLASYAGGPSKLSNVYATYHNGLGTEGHVLVAAQGDGVHVLDVSFHIVCCFSYSSFNATFKLKPIVLLRMLCSRRDSEY